MPATYETYQFLKAGKDHTCSICSGVIAKGMMHIMIQVINHTYPPRTIEIRREHRICPPPLSPSEDGKYYHLLNLTHQQLFLMKKLLVLDSSSANPLFPTAEAEILISQILHAFNRSGSKEALV